MSSQSQKLLKIRQLLKDNNVQGYVVPHNDAHDSEYIAEADERLAYISGFTGSAGMAFISLEEALLYADSRYFIQAEKQMEEGWKLEKIQAGYKPWNQFVQDKYDKGYKVGYDPLLMNAQNIKNTQQQLTKKGIELVSISENLVDKVWENKPKEPQEKVFEHEVQWHQYPFENKFNNIKQKVVEQGAQYLIVSKLDEIAWALNLRGNDISFNPVFKSYLILNFQENQQFLGTLYVDQQKIDEKVQKYLDQIKIQVKNYDQVFGDLKVLNAKVGLHPADINYRLYENIKNENKVVLQQPTPICILKALKNKKEIEGFRNCHIRDGAALISYLAWLEDQLLNKKNTELTEFTAANELEKRRRALEHNVGLSFDTISSIGANGAIVHYKPEENTAAKLNPDLVYLVDSGGQYLDGTTDVTRTLHFKTPTEEQKDSYTRVLLGNIDVQTLIWPKKNSVGGNYIDVLARRHLWKKKLDFGHGTGHGVGFFLNVHEGPQGISRLRNEVLQEGMTITDEPGYYKQGEYGIRIEDELVVIDIGEDYLAFENLTQCPYDRNMIDTSLLTKDHVDFINKYHQSVYEKVSPLLEKWGDELALNWLKKHTQPITL